METEKQGIRIEPTQRQVKFLTCPSDEILYGGARGGGKSFGLALAAIGTADQNLFNNANWSVLILRRTFGESEQTNIKLLKRLLGESVRYDAQKHRFTSPVGGTIQVGHIKNHDDIYKYQGAEYNRILFDELTHFTEDMYTFILTCLRTTDPKLKCQVYCSSNPGGLGHSWVKKRFIDIGDPNRIHKIVNVLPNGEEFTRTRSFVPSTVFDNKHIMENDPGYIQRLMDQPEIRRKAFLYGDWNIFSGQFFSDFTDEHICEPFDIPDFWPIWVAMDYGFETKCSIGFYTQDPDSETYYRFAEIYESKRNPHELPAMMRSVLWDKVKNLKGCFGDKRIMVKDELSVSTQEKFAVNGFYFSLAVDNRAEGWYRTRELLMKDKEGRPCFYVFNTCLKFIELIPEIIHCEKNPEDVSKGCETHIADEWRYFSIMRKAPTIRELEIADDVYINPVTGYIGGISRSSPVMNFRRLSRYSNPRRYILDGGRNVKVA